MDTIINLITKATWIFMGLFVLYAIYSGIKNLWTMK